MSNALLSTAMNHNIIIEQKFLEVGHTQMEADTMHSTIERVLKNKDINVPAEYVGVCRSGRKKPKPCDVTYLGHKYFKNFNDSDPKVTNIRALRYTPSGEIYFKLRFPDEWQTIPQRKSSNVVPLLFTQLRNLHATGRKITAGKFEDL
ncbi:unnamed protein product [Parnassius apollo]|uniref:(apollo) hypothetical protein n=1 Tax=Parnassius apollo TaxID=110799 RepID=A0A8S3WC73_PARAO|nr:unnamed protein product [Parnassius apollo]